MRHLEGGRLSYEERAEAQALGRQQWQLDKKLAEEAIRAAVRALPPERAREAYFMRAWSAYRRRRRDMQRRMTRRGGEGGG